MTGVSWKADVCRSSAIMFPPYFVGRTFPCTLVYKSSGYIPIHHGVFSHCSVSWLFSGLGFRIEIRHTTGNNCTKPLSPHFLFQGLYNAWFTYGNPPLSVQHLPSVKRMRTHSPFTQIQSHPSGNATLTRWQTGDYSFFSVQSELFDTDGCGWEENGENSRFQANGTNRFWIWFRA